MTLLTTDSTVYTADSSLLTADLTQVPVHPASTLSADTTLYTADTTQLTADMTQIPGLGGSLAATEAPDTASAVGTVTWFATMAATEAADAPSAIGGAATAVSAPPSASTRKTDNDPPPKLPT